MLFANILHFSVREGNWSPWLTNCINGPTTWPLPVSSLSALRIIMPSESDSKLNQIMRLILAMGYYQVWCKERLKECLHTGVVSLALCNVYGNMSSKPVRAWKTCRLEPSQSSQARPKSANSQWHLFMWWAQLRPEDFFYNLQAWSLCFTVNNLFSPSTHIFRIIVTWIYFLIGKNTLLVREEGSRLISQSPLYSHLCIFLAKLLNKKWIWLSN